MTSPQPQDRYLSATTLHEAAAVLRGLAGLLERVDGVFAEDAAADAAHLRNLADTLAEWWPHPALAMGNGAGPGLQPTWDDVLAVYVTHGLRTP
ncbi:hypothetical protein [Actinomycetospora sp. TBRC 11914]|uniref:hypothetical protein n=1 Tax=Actinomycetospora sp. TBRC 11914 TaxID=2729387 RepID=UPI00145E3121|nr:hypothetical protein [Actinomycetospora sp. TBRC 11914]NMO89469.1 hypothetical protein [Actinomycetospora sp. TBRC 11914]